MKIALLELFKAPGLSRTCETDLQLSELEYAGDRYPIGSARVNLVITHRQNRQVTVAGQAAFSLTMPCARCLSPVEVNLEFPIEQELDLSRTHEASDQDADAEQFYVSGDQLDVDLMAASEAVLYLPYRVLCREDCAGICPVCGKNRNTDPCDCEPRSLDPRMAKILKFMNKEV